MCRCSESAARRAIAELQSLSELKVESKADGRLGGNRARARHRVLMTSQSDPVRDCAGCQSDTPPGARGVKSGSTRCQNEPHEVSPVTPNSSRTIQNHGDPVENLVDHAAYAKLCRELLLAAGGDPSTQYVLGESTAEKNSEVAPRSTGD